MYGSGFDGDMDPAPSYGGSYDRGDSSDSFYGMCNCPSYRYEFKTVESLVTSKVFQEQLGKALAFKQKEIDSLRRELLEMHAKLEMVKEIREELHRIKL